VHVVKQKYKTIDVLVNNAGVAAKGDAFDPEVIRFTFETVQPLLFRTSMEPLNSHKNYCHLLLIMEKLLPLDQQLEKCVLVKLQTNC